ncbi:sodium-dependent transporter [Streptomyces seoulensis]|uniref:sodium-dependent transporter n=1 Tax=Streptomyces seoulensis TaxID=73044 RepID=UPI003C2FE54A
MLSPSRATTWLHQRLGRAVCVSYAAAGLLPAPGLWLRHPHRLPFTGAFTLSSTEILLGLVLFAAGLQVPVEAPGGLVRRPRALLAGLVLRLAVPALTIPVIAFLLRRTPDTDGGGGLVLAMSVIVAMPVAAGATVWAGKGGGDQPTMVGLVLVSTLLSPLTVPVVINGLSPLLGAGHVRVLAGSIQAGGSTLATVVMPCAAGVLSRLLLPAPWLRRVVAVALPTAATGSLVLTYLNASGALGSFLAHPRPLLLAAAVSTAGIVCLLSFAIGRALARLLRLPPSSAASLTLACGMNNSSAGAVLITTALPHKPQLLLPVLAYGLLQKTAANRLLRP